MLVLDEADPRNDLGQGGRSEFRFQISVTGTRRDGGLNAVENRRQKKVREVFLEREWTLQFRRFIVKKVRLSCFSEYC